VDFQAAFKCPELGPIKQAQAKTNPGDIDQFDGSLPDLFKDGVLMF